MAEHEQAEKKAIEKCIRSFRFYRKHALLGVHKSCKDYRSLSTAHQDLLPNFLSQMEDVKKCIDKNYAVILHMLAGVEHMFSDQNGQAEEESVGGSEETAMSGAGLSQFDLDKVYTTIRQLVRDWAAEGADERRRCYRPILEAVISRFSDPAGVEILVPGVGLGRLSWEFANRGYHAEGNEFSYHMLIASNFILNKAVSAKFPICPWSTTSTNNVCHSDRVREVRVPDVDTSSIPPSVRYGMCAGDFTEVYGRVEGKYDVVAACFFLDTAHNVVEYLEMIYRMLRPGGYLVSLGPLLYHYAGIPSETSIEIPWEDLMAVVKKIGFEVEEERDVANVPYINNSNSMLNVSYQCKLLVAKKS